jgi:hypothetical protein
MIKADVFYPRFEAGFVSSGGAAQVARGRGKIPKYTAQTPVGKLSFWFQVNSKASAIPYQPGEFWPVIDAATLRHNERDRGVVSWYQYTDAAMNEAIHERQRLVYQNVESQATFEPEFWRQARDLWLSVSRDSIGFELKPGFPHTRLFYLDPEDAEQWGALFGRQMEAWLARFCEQPETLEAHMWRTHWRQPPPG